MGKSRPNYPLKLRAAAQGNRIESHDESYNRSLLAAEVDKAIAQFPAEGSN